MCLASLYTLWLLTLISSRNWGLRYNKFYSSPEEKLIWPQLWTWSIWATASKRSPDYILFSSLMVEEYRMNMFLKTPIYISKQMWVEFYSRNLNCKTKELLLNNIFHFLPLFADDGVATKGNHMLYHLKVYVQVIPSQSLHFYCNFLKQNVQIFWKLL